MSNIQDLKTHIKIVLHECRDQIPDLSQAALKEITTSIEEILENVSYPSTRLELRKLLRASLDSHNSSLHTLEIIDICFPSALGPFAVWPRRDSQSIKPIQSNIPKTFPLISSSSSQGRRTNKPFECFTLHSPAVRTRTNQELYELVRDYQPDKSIQDVAPSAESHNSSSTTSLDTTRMILPLSVTDAPTSDHLPSAERIQPLIDFESQPILSSYPQVNNETSQTWDIQETFLKSFKSEISCCIHSIRESMSKTQRVPIILPIIHGSLWRECNTLVSILLDECNLNEISNNTSSHTITRMDNYQHAVIVKNHESIRDILNQYYNSTVIILWNVSTLPISILQTLYDCECLSPIYLHALSVKQQDTIWKEFWKIDSKWENQKEYILQRTLSFGFYAFMDVLNELQELKISDNIQCLLERMASKYRLTLGGENICFKLNQIYNIHTTKENLEWEWGSCVEIPIKHFDSAVIYGCKLAHQQNVNSIHLINMRFILDNELHSKVCCCG